eukprot:gene493-1039_t
MHNITIDRTKGQSLCTRRDTDECSKTPRPAACPACCVDCQQVLVVEPTVLEPNPTLVLFLHDKKQSADGSFGAAGLFSKRAVDARNTIYVIPQARSNAYGQPYWYSTNSHDVNGDCFGDPGPCARIFEAKEVLNDVSFLSALIHAAQTEYKSIKNVFVWGEGNGGDMATDLVCRVGLDLGVQGAVVRRSPGYVSAMGSCAYNQNIWQYSEHKNEKKKTFLGSLNPFSAKDNNREIFAPWVTAMGQSLSCLDTPVRSEQFLGLKSVLSSMRPDTDIYQCGKATFAASRQNKTDIWKFNSGYLRDVFHFIDGANLAEKVVAPKDSQVAPLLSTLKTSYKLGVNQGEEEIAFKEIMLDGDKCEEHECGRKLVTKREQLRKNSHLIPPAGATQEELDAWIMSQTRSILRAPRKKKDNPIASESTTRNFLRTGMFAQSLAGEIPQDILEEVSDELEREEQVRDIAEENRIAEALLIDGSCVDCDMPAQDPITLGSLKQMFGKVGDAMADVITGDNHGKSFTAAADEAHNKAVDDLQVQIPVDEPGIREVKPISRSALRRGLRSSVSLDESL